MDWIEWIEHHPGLAAWVQAIGTLIAIGIAIGVPAWQLRYARKAADDERLLKARGIFRLIYPELMACRIDVDRAIRFLDRQAHDGAGVTPLVALASIRVRIPQLLYQRVDSLYLFGAPAGHTLQELVAAVIAFQSISVAAEETARGPGTEVAEICDMFAGHVRMMAGLLSDADEQLTAFVH